MYLVKKKKNACDRSSLIVLQLSDYSNARDLPRSVNDRRGIKERKDAGGKTLHIPKVSQSLVLVTIFHFSGARAHLLAF